MIVRDANLTLAILERFRYEGVLPDMHIYGHAMFYLEIDQMRVFEHRLKNGCSTNRNMSFVALQTLNLLERRLARLAFFLGDPSTEGDEAQANSETIVSRLSRVEARLSELCSGCPQAAEIMQLRTC